MHVTCILILIFTLYIQQINQSPFCNQNSTLTLTLIVAQLSHLPYNIIQKHIGHHIIGTLMQQAALHHNILTFTHNKQSFVYGLSYLVLNSNCQPKYLLKYRPKYLIIPTRPYIYGDGPANGNANGNGNGERWGFGVFAHAAIQGIVAILVEKMGNRDTNTPYSQSSNPSPSQIEPTRHYLNKVLKHTKIILSNPNSLLPYCSQQTIHQLIQSGMVKLLSQFGISEKELINKFFQLSQKVNRIEDKDFETEKKQKKKEETQNRKIKVNDVELHKWINCPKFQLKIMVTEGGSSTYLCHGQKIIVIDPTQQFTSFLSLNKVIKNSINENNLQCPNLLTLLQTVIITKLNSIPSLLQLMLIDIPNKLHVLVIDPYLQSQIITLAHTYLSLPEQLLRSRFLIRNLSHMSQSSQSLSSLSSSCPLYPLLAQNLNPFILQSPNTLSCKYIPLSPLTMPRLEIYFGSSLDLEKNKRIVFPVGWKGAVKGIGKGKGEGKGKEDMQMDMQMKMEGNVDWFPKEITHDNVEYVVLYKVGDQLMKQLKSLPELIRKKIILNRNEHKYCHKYFMTFTQQSPFCTITDTQYLSLVSPTKIKIPSTSPSVASLPSMQSLNFLQIRQKKLTKNMEFIYQLDRGCKIYQMGQGAEMEIKGQVVTVLEGFVLVYGIGDWGGSEGKDKAKMKVVGEAKQGEVRDAGRIKALRYAIVKVEMQNDFLIRNNLKTLILQQQTKIRVQTPSRQKSSKPQSSKPLLSLPIPNPTPPLPIPPLSVPTITSSLLSLHPLSTIDSNSLLQSLSLEQKVSLNSICVPVTYQVGYKMNNKNQYVYFISKGGMKWEDGDLVAGTGGFIGDLQWFYENRATERKRLGELNGQEQNVEFDNFIEVIKDTWALEINIQEFHKYFLMKYPHLVNFIFMKGKIFQ